MSTEPDEYHHALGTLESALRDAIKAFVGWHVENWKMTGDEWKHDANGLPPNPAYVNGYNAGIEAAASSLDMFLDEFHP